ncbi:hypothetical protein FJQ98_14130 [Lysinibacillus agricola]|uniref:Terminase n=1 Tax=Lysinibacillus agricola TaxID=2590012 RepID=A0ABX7AKS5_9BACI|nr:MULTISPECIES: hypothetical protein [Lysinibacillus]KOS64631.1 hypothetical protein AN161_00990 [Lysinibacillus sp. FJAT-14222]QQP10426.1 hypothetical protein FJQ98_14130 [Lysinibacillus agricola]
MEPTIALRDRLRKMINDIIPKGGTDKDTTFSNAELDDMLRESESIYYAASEGWTIKAGLLEGDIEGYSAGNEKYELTKLQDRLAHALRMAQKYKEQANEVGETQSSFLLKFKAPDVM